MENLLDIDKENEITDKLETQGDAGNIFEAEKPDEEKEGNEEIVKDGKDGLMGGGAPESCSGGPIEESQLESLSNDNVGMKQEEEECSSKERKEEECSSSSKEGKEEEECSSSKEATEMEQEEKECSSSSKEAKEKAKEECSSSKEGKKEEEECSSSKEGKKEEEECSSSKEGKKEEEECSSSKEGKKEEEECSSSKEGKKEEEECSSSKEGKKEEEECSSKEAKDLEKGKEGECSSSKEESNKKEEGPCGATPIAVSAPPTKSSSEPHSCDEEMPQRKKNDTASKGTGASTTAGESTASAPMTDEAQRNGQPGPPIGGVTGGASTDGGVAGEEKCVSPEKRDNTPEGCGQHYICRQLYIIANYIF